MGGCEDVTMVTMQDENLQGSGYNVSITDFSSPESKGRVSELSY
jgi:hypothetical protein